jgi:uncharacterized protein YjbI with pentapeptide repeats
MATEQVSKLKSDYRDVDLSRKRMYNANFAGQDLSKLRLRQSLFYNCNFDGANLSETDCEGSEFFGSSFREAVLYRTNFKDAKLAGTVFEPKDCFGMTVTLQCKTFDQMKVSQLWWFGFLFFATMMKPDRFPVQEELLDKLIAMIGAERYVKLRNLFAKREY